MARRRLRFNRNSEADVDMTPMLDIVFILLIFFIVTAVFLDEEGLDFTKTEGLEPLTPCLLYTSPSPRDGLLSRMPSSA